MSALPPAGDPTLRKVTALVEFPYWRTARGRAEIAQSLSELYAARDRCRRQRRLHPRQAWPFLCIDSWTVVHQSGGHSIEVFLAENRTGRYVHFARYFGLVLALHASDPTQPEAKFVLEQRVLPALRDVERRRSA